MEKTYKILKLLIWVLLFAVLMIGAYMLYNRLSGGVNVGGIATTPQASEHTGEAVSETEARPSLAPDFTVYDLEGNAHKLSDFRGKPVLLNFWASWCGPCQMEMPDFNEKYLELGEEVHFLMINMADGKRETVESASAFIQENGYTLPVFYDTDSIAGYIYQVYSLPTTFFIDANGNAVAQVPGGISAATLQRGIDMIYP